MRSRVIQCPLCWHVQHTTLTLTLELSLGTYAATVTTHSQELMHSQLTVQNADLPPPKRTVLDLHSQQVS